MNPSNWHQAFQWSGTLAIAAALGWLWGRRQRAQEAPPSRDDEHERLVGNVLALFNAGDRALLMLDAQGRLEAFNARAHDRIKQALGLSQQAGMRMGALLPPRLRAPVGRAFAQALQGEEPQVEADYDLPDGGRTRLLLHLLPVFAGDGAVRSICVSLETLDRLQRAEDALRETEERFLLAARGSQDGLWDLDVKRNSLYVSPRWEAQAGLPEGQGPRTLEQWVESIHPEDRPRVNERLQAHWLGISDRFEAEYRLRNPDGDYTWMLGRGKAVTDAKGEPIRMAGSQTDIHQGKQRESNLQRDALRDPVTQLPNRALILDRLDHCLARARRSGQFSFAVVYLDIDNFKSLFRTLGQAGSEEALRAMARRLQALLRPGDTVARLGSGEFALLLDELAAPDDARVVVKRLLDDAKRPLQVHGRDCYVTVSVGLAQGHAGLATPLELLVDGETAMVQAKSIPRGLPRLAVFEKSMLQAAVTRQDLELELRQALLNGQVRMHYQPLVDLESGRLTGFEALARWQHPLRGMVPPSEFVPVAEDCGLILDLGRLALRQGLEAMAAWGPQAAGLKMSVNLSPHQLDDPDFLGHLNAALQQTGVRPQQLQLEITEGVIMAKGRAGAGVLEALRERGMTIAIDDFGTGYSSLSYLHQFPADTLKIDRAFVSRMDGLPANEAVTGAIIALGLNLGKNLVAEGIETDTQARRLRLLGCQTGQGYLFGKAMPQHEATALLDTAFALPELA